MKTHLQPRTRQSGFTYVAVVITMIVVGTMLTAYLKMVSVQNQSTMRSQAWNRTVPVLEAGVEEAIAHMNKNAAANPGGTFSLNLSADGWASTGDGGWFKVGQIGEDFYYTKITRFVAGNYYPFIQSTGFVKQLSTLSMKTMSGPFIAAVSLDELLRAGYVKRSVLCGTTNLPTFTKALVAKKGIDMSGQHVRTDSFDSSDPALSDGFGHYTNSPGKWRSNGDIASNDTITNAVSLGNANIYGKVATGPFGTVNVGSAGMVGDANWQGNILNVGKIQPGWSTDDMNTEFPSVIVPPELYGATPPTGQQFTDSNGYTYTTYLRSAPNQTNDVALPVNTSLSGGLYIEGTVRLLVQKGINMSGQDRITLAPGATLYLYADCPSAALGGNGIQNPGTAEHFYYFGTDKNTSLSYGGNAAFTAVFYAPNAAMNMGGGGNTQTDFSGSAIARSIKLNGNFTFHYDENLKRVGLYRGYILTSWNEK